MGQAAADPVQALDAVPEHLPLLLLDAAVGFGVVENVDLVVVARAPVQLRGFLAHHLPYRPPQAFALGLVEHGELVQVHALGRIDQDHRGAVVLAHVGTQQRGALEVVRHQGTAETGFDQRLQRHQIQLVPGSGTLHPFATPHQGARALVGEQLLGQVGRAGDRHRGGQRQPVEQVLDLLDLHPHAAIDPRLLHQVLELGGQVDRIDHPALLVEQAAGAGEEDDLVRLQHLDQLVGGKIGIDVEDLATGGLAQAGDHRDRTGLQAGLDRRQVDRSHLTDQAVGVAVQVLRFEHAAGDRGRARPALLQRLDQAQVGGLEHLAHDRQRFGRGHPQAVDGLLLDPGRGQFFVQLRPGTVDHDRGQSDFLQEGQRGGQRLQVIAQHRAADLDHGEALGVQLRETLQVLADLLRTGHARKQAHDGLAGLGLGGGNVHFGRVCGWCRGMGGGGAAQAAPLMMRFTDSA